MKKIFLLFAFISIIMINNAKAQTTIRYVKYGGTGNGISWENASGDIQTMINASSNDDQVWIAAGTYNLTATLEMENRVNVYGGFVGTETDISQRQKSDLDNNGIIEPWEFSNATILNGQDARRVLNQASAFTRETTWDGFTITGGKITATNAQGGGAYIRANGKLMNCIINNNIINSTLTNATVSGAGIYNDGGTISCCMVNSNTASGTSSNAIVSGAGIYNDGGTISHCMISDNTANSDNNSVSIFGGGIYNNEGTIIYCMIIGNIVFTQPPYYSYYPYSYGGGIYCINSTTSIVSDCIIKNNKAIKNNLSYSTYCRGGGIYQGNISRCIIKENHAGYGGGLYLSVANNSLILLNRAVYSGDGFGGGGYGGTYTNCSFIENIAGSSGGGIYGTSSGNSATATNCIFWRNAATLGPQVQGGTYAVVTYSAVQGGYTGTGNIMVAENNESGGPLFVNPDMDNYQLRSGSPCINAGSNSVLSAGDTTDLAGNSRIYNNIVDMGAYEYMPSTYTISGQISYNDNPLSEVTIDYGNNLSVITDINGEYTINITENSTLTLTPSLEGYMFSPVYLTFNNVTNNFTDQNFTADLITTHTISGQVIHNGNPLAEVTISYAGGSATTNTLGEYSITVNYNSSLVLTPSLAGYTFTPTSITCNNVINDITNQNFTAQLNTYTISGQVIHNGNGLNGITISYDGGSATTNAAGAYSITVNYNSSLVLTPSLAGYTFMPASITCNNITGNLTNQNFTAQLNSYTISGQVIHNSNPLAGVIINHTGGAAVTNTSGEYSITVNYNSSLVLTPSLAGYTFMPAYITCNNVTNDITNQNFTAQLNTYTISGQVIHNGSPLAGVTISHTEGATVTNISGEYSITVSYNSSLTLTPSLEGYTFTPASITCNNVTNNLINQNFSATENIGISNIIDENSIIVYPNPASTELQIKLDSHETVNYAIYNVMGQTLQQGKLQKEATIDIKHLSNGIYYIKLIGKENATIKFIKK